MEIFEQADLEDIWLASLGGCIVLYPCSNPKLYCVGIDDDLYLPHVDTVLWIACISFNGGTRNVPFASSTTVLRS